MITMTRVITLLLLVTSALISVPAAAAGTTCPTPKYMAPLPATIQNPSAPWGTTDTGAIVDGFVGIPGTAAVMHGIDLSSNNTIKDYGKYSACGAKFAFLRLDAQYGKHAQSLAAQQWTTIPYVFLSIPPAMRAASAYVNLKSSDSAAMTKNIDAFGHEGMAGATALPGNLAKFGLQKVPTVTFAGMSGQLIALDVEQKLDNEKSPNARQRYGQFYARAVCAWITEARVRIPGLQVIIYTTPSVFGDYLQAASPEDDNCLRGIPLWMARTTRDGGDLIGVIGSTDVNDKYAQRACLQPAGNRCIVHQYSHRGVVGEVLPVSNPATPHVDFNRAFPVKAVSDAKTAQYVRQ